MGVSELGPSLEPPSVVGWVQNVRGMEMGVA